MLGEMAPPWQVTRWFNTEQPLGLDALRGRVIALHAFQMLCPGCVSHAIPQAQRIRQTFAASDVAVVGLHTVFEHHEAMGEPALAAFLHEYRIAEPVGIDRAAADGDVPLTMRAYRMRGTPTLVLIDRGGRIRAHHFGRLPDLQVGAEIAALVAEPRAAADCTADGCEIPAATRDRGPRAGS